MTDIVQRLRLIDPNQVLLAAPPHDTSYLQAGLICHEAATEIERLRRALKFIKNLTVEIDGCPASAFQTEGWMREIAREALEDKP